MKHIMLALGLGILSATIILSVAYYFEDKSYTETTLSTKDMIKMLEEDGYSITDNSQQVETKQPMEEEKPQALNQPNRTEEQNDNDNLKEKKQQVINYTLVIEQGMSSITVANLLYEAGIVSDRDESIRFFEDNGYNTKIQIGEFNLTNEMSLTQIAEIITGGSGKVEP